MQTREQLIARIRKLYADTGRTPAELKAMHAKARELMDRHGITRAEVFAKVKQPPIKSAPKSPSTAAATITFEIGGLSVRLRL